MSPAQKQRDIAIDHAFPGCEKTFQFHPESKEWRESVESEGDTINLIRKLYQLSQEDRRNDDTGTYLECPRCKGYHSIHGQFDNLCPACCETLVQHFPDHESVPHIMEANAKWKLTSSAPSTTISAVRIP